jgi:hypothetical protein
LVPILNMATYQVETTIFVKTHANHRFTKTVVSTLYVHFKYCNFHISLVTVHSFNLKQIFMKRLWFPPYMISLNIIIVSKLGYLIIVHSFKFVSIGVASTCVFNSNRNYTYCMVHVLCINDMIDMSSTSVHHEQMLKLVIQHFHIHHHYRASPYTRRCASFPHVHWRTNGDFVREHHFREGVRRTPMKKNREGIVWPSWKCLFSCRWMWCLDF